MEVLFAPKYFRGYRPIASSTGIIRMSSLSELFPQYDPDNVSRAHGQTRVLPSCEFV